MTETVARQHPMLSPDQEEFALHLSASYGRKVADRYVKLLTSPDYGQEKQRNRKPVVKNVKCIINALDFVSTDEVLGILGCTRQTLARYRQNWIEGVHFVKHKKRLLYNRALIVNLSHCGGDVSSREHQRAIAAYQKYINTKLGGQA